MDDPAVEEVRLLLALLADATDDPRLRELESTAIARVRPDDDIARWAESGAMALSGERDGPPVAPLAPVASRLAGAGAVLAQLTAAGGSVVDVDAPALLGERAALRGRDQGGGLGRHGTVSAGGSCRLLRAADGWVAVALTRDDDWDLVPAWLGIDNPDWDAVAAEVGVRPAAALATAAAELGLAVAVVPAGDRPDDEQWRSRHDEADDDRPWVITCTKDRGAAVAVPARVLDLSSLWAGPLCASLLRLVGAHVVTVDSIGRPDGAQRGDPGLHELLHAGHDVVPIDLRDGAGRDELRRLVDASDVVVTGARPRALLQLGFDPAAEVARRPGLTWVVVTAYGATGPWCNRVGYGDDTAVAGGLVVPGPTPMFCGDAIADPSTGLFAAIAALAVARVGGGLVDVALREVAAYLARPPAATGPRNASDAAGRWVVRVDGCDVPVRPPRARAGVSA